MSPTAEPGDPQGIDRLRTLVYDLKREVDSIQIKMLSATKPWYRQVSSLVAVLALLFSFGTTYVSYQRAQKQDTQAARAALRALLQRLTTLPKENFELFIQYDDPAAAMQLSSFVNQENTILVTQALELIHELRDVVSSSELLAAGYAANLAGMIPEANRLIGLAAERATNFSDAVAAYRTLGAQAYAYGNLVEGEAHYTEALNIFSRFGVPNEEVKNFTHLQTENFWAQSEVAIGRCERARQHFEQARAYASAFREPARTQQFGVLAATEAALRERCGER